MRERMNQKPGDKLPLNMWKLCHTPCFMIWFILSRIPSGGRMFRFLPTHPFCTVIGIVTTPVFKLSYSTEREKKKLIFFSHMTSNPLLLSRRTIGLCGTLTSHPFIMSVLDIHQRPIATLPPDGWRRQKLLLDIIKRGMSLCDVLN